MTLSRRQFLAGGVSLGVGGLLASRLNLVERAYAATPTPCAPLSDIEHVVFMMQENRSYDHYFGTYHGGLGFDDPAVLRQAAGLPVLAQPGYAAGRDPSGYLLPYHLNTTDLSTYAECVNDITHDWGPQHDSWNEGAMDRWVETHLAVDGSSIGPISMGYYDRQDIPFYYALADAFTLCDGYHCSVMGPTDPNRLYAMTGTLGPSGEQGGPILSTSTTRVERRSTLSWTTMPQVLQEAGVSWKVYQPPDGYLFNPLTYFSQHNDPASPLFAAAYPTDNFPVEFEADVLAGSLPSVSWIIPSLIQSEHPAAPPEYGEVFVLQALNALLANPAVWEKTALFVTYDENGGFFDHVPPPVAPAGAEGEFLTVATPPSGYDGFLGPIGLGFRVPMLVISPYSRGGFVSSDVFDHTSMLRFLERRFGVEAPNITPWRRQTVGDLTAAFNFSGAVQPDVPALPQPSLTAAAVLAECLPGGLTGTEDSGPTYPVPPNSTPHQEAGARAPAPSGLVCAAAATGSTSAAPSPAAAAPTTAASGGAGGAGGTLAATGADPDLAIAGAALAVAAVLARRLSRAADDPEG